MLDHMSAPTTCQCRRRELQENIPIATFTVYTGNTMVGLLSLPGEVTELVIKQVVGRQQIGLGDWCRASSTCKRLWSMPLPKEVIPVFVNLDVGIHGGF